MRFISFMTVFIDDHAVHRRKISSKKLEWKQVSELIMRIVEDEGTDQNLLPMLFLIRYFIEFSEVTTVQHGDHKS